ncbi:hypothetical protein RUM43_001359 [Polyplax serrata]|uniref:5'-nucleotidase domain-containing protein 3 n=1 Tax=Polyplax serrata TaxID=468196 RepID=A0AAN8XPL8_POLSC
MFAAKTPPRDVNPNGVFACNELFLGEISVYGFDYDYTLACYKPSMDLLIFNLGKEALVKKFMVWRRDIDNHSYPCQIKLNNFYPKDILELEYNPDFTIRGLHYDIEKGLFMKLDSFLQIQLGTVYKGLTPVSDEKVIELYKNKVIPIAYVEAKGKFGQGRSKLYQLADLFSRPEMSLLCCIIDYLNKAKFDYHPEIVFRDVRSAIGSIHPVMHNEVMENTKKYLEENPNMRKLITKLKSADKKLFLITNSPYHFVNKGLNLIVGEDWNDFFDIVIVQARKPKFFTDESTPIRIFDKNLNTQLWDRVSKLEKGTIYCEGTMKQLKEITGWVGSEVLYFGDHPYSDLADVTLEHGWRTGAIIHELTHEIDTLNNPKFKGDSNWLHVLTQLIEAHADLVNDNESAKEMDRWIEERNDLLLR